MTNAASTVLRCPDLAKSLSGFASHVTQGITLHCGENVNAVLGHWVPSHRLGDPLSQTVSESRPLCVAAANGRPPCLMLSVTPARVGA